MIADQLILNNKENKTTYQDDKTSEKPIRSIAKAFSWRVIGTVDTLIISYILTGKFSVAASIASIDFVTKMILYFFHERFWNLIKWGK
ncbi:DUF2061 domain-containing protein [Maribacter arcticus]|jgi:uncharacterized membrane protein|uniref:DUF2061 domain-containing protein n=1 Tax=Maribacter arcticus TaxID=561365 RepID=UPI003002D082